MPDWMNSLPPWLCVLTLAIIGVPAGVTWLFSLAPRTLSPTLTVLITLTSILGFVAVSGMTLRHHSSGTVAAGACFAIFASVAVLVAIELRLPAIVRRHLLLALIAHRHVRELARH